MKIRVAKKDDLKVIQKLLYEEDLYHYENDKVENKKPVVGSRPDDVVLDNLDTPTSKFFLADEDNEVAGLVWVAIKIREENGVFNKKTFGYINDIGVSEKFRGRGLGRKLLEQAIKWVKEQDVGTLELRVDSFNKPAIGLYKNKGFVDKSHNLELKL